MNEPKPSRAPNRRELLAAGAAGAVVATGGGVAASRAGADAAPELVRDGDGAPLLGPRNVPVERENPDLLAPPATDAGTLSNLRIPFDAAHNRLTPGGWAPEVNVRELPIATQLAAVNMRLKPGAIRELHWHKAAEWAFMIAGTARITAVDPEGRNFIAEVEPGDTWNFPAGIPHSIQGLEHGCEFLLVFDDGNFSENETFLLTDWFAHTPPAVLAKTSAFPGLRLPTYPRTSQRSCTSSRATCRGPSRYKRSALQRAPILGATSTGCSPRDRSRAQAGGCASSTRPPSPRRARSQRRWLRSIPVGCASCTGARRRTSGSTTSAAGRA